MTAFQNKARTLEMLERVMNQHDVDVLREYTSNPGVIAAGKGLVRSFPDLESTVRWAVADDDMVAVFHDVRGTHLGPWLFVSQPTGRRVETSFVITFRFDADGQIIDSWLGSNFIQMLAQLGWGFAPVGERVPLPT